MQLLDAALWGAFGLLIYSAGNLFITVFTVGGLVAPSAAHPDVELGRSRADRRPQWCSRSSSRWRRRY
jgi:hypothetical protein